VKYGGWLKKKRRKKEEKKTRLLAYSAIDKDRLQHLQDTVTGLGFSEIPARVSAGLSC
jgi:hypothetical protein